MKKQNQSNKSIYCIISGMVIPFLIFAIVCLKARISVPFEKNMETFSAERETEEKKSISELSEKYAAVDDSGKIHFTDACGSTFEVGFHPEYRLHSYDWSYLSGNKHGKMTYSDENFTSRWGIDVSKYQQSVDWKSVKSQGISFAILRIGYRGYGQKGKICSDEMFEKHFSGAKEAGLDVGVYFFSQAVNENEAKEEAEFVLKQLHGRALECPVFFDPENIFDDEARTDDISGEQFTRNSIVFCDTIEASGYQAMVYSNMLWESFMFDMSQIEDYGIWYADCAECPQTPYDFCFWQYTASGRIDGMDGKVDLDLQFIPAGD